MPNNRKGIVLAGGKGSRLNPITLATSKQLLPVYDKPMIYYPISVLMLSKIQEIAIISSPEHIDAYKKLLGDGKNIGVNFQYFTQNAPNGLAEAFILTESFIKKDPSCLILGDNIFYGQGFEEKIMPAQDRESGATIFGYQVSEPSRFGVVEFDEKGNTLSIEEKPKHPKSNYAVTGLYYYDNDVIDIAKNITPSTRGELEITDVNLAYLNNGNLKVEDFGRGFAWLDMGTHDSLLEAGQFIRTIEKQQGLKIACLEEIAYSNGWINYQEMLNIADKMIDTQYGRYLLQIIKRKTI